MKIRNVAALSAVVTLGAFSPVSAATYYWDNDGTTAGFGTASGTWAAPTVGSASEGWSTSNTGVLLPGTVTTANGDILNFGTSTSGLAGGPITVGGTVTAGNVTFGSASGPITLSGGTITGTASVYTVNNATDTINSAIAGTGGLTKASTGNLILGGVNTYSGGTTLNGGTLTLNRDTGSLLSASAFNANLGKFVVSNSNASGTQAVALGGLTLGSTTTRSGAVTIQADETGAGAATLTFSTINAGVATSGVSVNYVTTGTSSIISTNVGGSGFGNRVDNHSFFNGSDYAYITPGGAVRAVNYGTDTGALVVSGTITSGAGNNWLLTASNSGQSGGTNFNTMKISGAGAINWTSTGSNDSIGGFLRTGGGTTIISGTTAYRSTTGSADVVFRTDSVNDSIRMDSQLNAVNSTNGQTYVTKAGLGTLTLNANNSFGGHLSINEGTVVVTNDKGLGFGMTVGSAAYVAGNTVVNPGATLDVNSAAANRTVNEPIVLNGGNLVNSSATNTSTIDNGIAAVTLTNVGTGYTGTPTWTVTGGGGTGAVVTGGQTATVNTATATLTTAGSGYTSAPNVTVTGGGGTGAVAVATLSSVSVAGTANTIGGAGTLNIKAVVADGASSGGFTKVGAGTLNLSAVNTYTGSTTVSAGTLLISGSIANTNGIVVNGGNLTSSAALSANLGTGAVSMSSGAINPGGLGSVATFTLASGQNLTSTGGTFNFDLGSTFDQIASLGSGTFSLTGTTLALDITSIGGFSYGSTYAIFNGFASGTNSGLTITGYDTVNYTASLNSAGLLAFNAVPEPSTYALVGMGLASLWFLRRRKSKISV